DLAPANITDGEAEAKADAIYGAYGYTNDDFDAIANALTSPILNYNGYIKLYNAYGHRDDLDLEASFRDHFNDFEVAQLSSYLGGAFF
ncbi:MAG TPA: hypothetical protein VK528_14385, partial [Flavobacterium sp.]|nr:hypothetical protein [Flavobacterium sp.]